jgi:hypothetical protein
MLTVNRLGLPVKLRRSLACTNSIENMMGTVRRVCRNVKRWRNAAMALRWTAAGMMEAAKGFRRLKAYKHLPFSELRLQLINPSTSPNELNKTLMPHSIIPRRCLLRLLQQNLGHPAVLTQPAICRGLKINRATPRYYRKAQITRRRYLGGAPARRLERATDRDFKDARTTAVAMVSRR